MGSKGALRKTRYPQIYERVNEAGKVTGYAIKPRFKGYTGKSKTFDRLTDAREEMDRIRTDVRDGKLRGNSRKTLRQAIAKYREEEMPHLAESERRTRAERLAWWEARRGDEYLPEITRPMISEDLRDLRLMGPAGRPVKAATANRYKAALGAVLSCAVEEWHWLPVHPLRGGGRRRQAKGEREEERERELSDDERERLWEACRACSDPRLLQLVIVAYRSGARQGELMGLEWARVQLHPTVYDPETGSRRPGSVRAEARDTKTGGSRILYFPGEGGDILRELAKVPRLSRFVFAGPDDAPTVRPQFPTPAWRSAKNRAKIEDFRFHDLRHCWAVSLLDEGATTAQLMVLGGWKTASMVRRYASRAQREGSAPR